jgi:hypothetical protein
MEGRVRVENGRIHIDQPTDLPDGTELELVIADEGDELSPDERRALNAALEAGWAEVEAGEVQPASEVLDELRRRQ